MAGANKVVEKKRKQRRKWLSPFFISNKQKRKCWICGIYGECQLPHGY
jgi:hypothetical protein